MYVADLGAYNVVRKITVSTGIISTVAGSGSGGYNGDNIQATAATLYTPYDVALDGSGNMYISDSSNNRIRKVDVSTGIITTVVGTGTASSTGDGSAATSATINGPSFSRFDSSGNYYISDSGGNRIRKVITVSTEIPTSLPSFTPRYYYDLNRYSFYRHNINCITNCISVSPTAVPSTASPSTSPTYYPTLSPHSISIITTIAGTGTASYSGDGGQATAATFNNPRGIDFDSSGNIYFAECSNHRVRKITVSTGIISTYVGTGSGVYSGDGVVASSATLTSPIGLCLDTAGTDQYMQPALFNI